MSESEDLSVEGRGFNGYLRELTLGKRVPLGVLGKTPLNYAVGVTAAANHDDRRTVNILLLFVIIQR
jgi:hypothetical protein